MATPIGPTYARANPQPTSRPRHDDASLPGTHTSSHLGFPLALVPSPMARLIGAMSRPKAVAVDDELITLASSGATTLIGLMVTDGWKQARAKVAKLFGGGVQQRIQEVENELDQSRAQLVAAEDCQDGITISDLEAEWRSRLRRLLAAEPSAAAALRSIIDEFSPDGKGVSHSHVEIRDNTISGSVVLGTGTIRVRFSSR